VIAVFLSATERENSEAVPIEELVVADPAKLQTVLQPLSAKWPLICGEIIVYRLNRTTDAR
jgi:hypothetical protein